MRTRLLRDFIFRRTSARLMHVKLKSESVYPVGTGVCRSRRTTGEAEHDGTDGARRAILKDWRELARTSGEKWRWNEALVETQSRTGDLLYELVSVKKWSTTRAGIG